MSTGRRTEDLVARLTENLAPVRAIAALHRRVLAVAAIWAGTAAVAAMRLGLHPLAVLERGGISTALVWVLALIGFSGVMLGLASRIPGRERLALAAATGVALGVAIAIAAGATLLGSPAEAGTLAQSMDCVGRSLYFAFPAGLLATWLALRGAPWRSATAGVGVAVGAISLGALLVHLSCPSPSAWHWWLAHALLPLAAGLPLGLFVAWALERSGQRSRRASLDALDA